LVPELLFVIPANKRESREARFDGCTWTPAFAGVKIGVSGEEPLLIETV
jgi:hypothetical protein